MSAPDVPAGPGEARQTDYRLLFDRIAETFGVVEIVYDAEERYRDCILREANLAFAHAIGRPREDILNRPAREVIDITPDVEVCLRVYEQVARTGKPAHFDTHYAAGQRHFHVSAFPLSPRLVGVLSVDTTQRTEAERRLRELNETLEQRVRDRAEQLRASEELFAKVFRMSPTPMVITGLADRRFVDVNDSFMNTFGHKRDEIIGLTTTEPRLFVNEAQLDEFRQCILRDGHMQDYEAPLRTRAGEIRHGLLSGVRVSLRGREHVLTTMVDITDRRKAEQCLRDARDDLDRKVRERTAQLQALAAELVHAEERERARIADILHDDLQQILVAARYTLETLTRSCAPDRAPVTQSLDEMLRKALDTSRELTVTLRPPALYEIGLIAALARLAAEMEKAHGLVVDLQVDATAEPGPMDRRVFLYRAARELLLNVLKHSGVKAVTVRLAHEHNGRVLLEVRDRGRGFEAGALQPDGSGLFSIRERARLFGGDMEIRAAPGEGVRARILLPSC